MIPTSRTLFGAIVLAAALAAAARAADPADPTPAALQKAEAAYRDAFGPAHDKAAKATRPAEKSDFARKLADAAQKAGGDPALQDVLRKYALVFAQADAVGTAVALEVHRAYLAFPSRRAASLERIAAVQERGVATEPPAGRLKLAADAIKGYRDAAAEYERQGNAAAAVAAVGKARAAARRLTPAARDVLAALDADERRLQSLTADQAEAEKLRLAVEKAPDDAKARLALGCRLLRSARPRDAAEHFRAAGGDDWPAVAKALADPTPDGLATARLVTKAAATLPADDRRSRYAAFDFAKTLMEDARAKSPDRWPAALPAYAALLDRTFGLEPPGQTARLSAAILFAQLDLADAHGDRGAYSDALYALGKARAATKTMRPADARDFLPELDAVEKAVRTRVALEAEVDKLQAAAAPLDAKGRLALGIGLVRLGKLSAAAAPLKACGVKAWEDVAAAAADPKAKPLDVGNALRAAAADLRGEERVDVLAAARDRYEDFLATNPPDLDRTRVELIAGELPVSPLQTGRAKAVDLLTPANLKAITEKGLTNAKVTADGGTWKVDVEDRTLWKADWQYRVVEKPARPDEVRYVGFAWKADGGADARVYLPTSVQVKYHGYFAGKLAADRNLLAVAPDPPHATTVVVRDLVKDFGAGWTIAGMGMGAVDKSPTQFSAFVLGRSPEQVRRALARAVRE